MTRLRVLIADDHAVVRQGLRAILEAADGIDVVAEAADGATAVAEAAAARPDVVVMDVRMRSEVDGVEACREIKSQQPDTAVLMLTSFGGADAVLASFMAGASGFLVKNTGSRELIRAVQAVGGGASLLDPSVMTQVASKLSGLAAGDPHQARAQVLSEREREVLRLIARGFTNRQIADELVIAPATARNHVSHILDKLGMRRRSEAAAFAAEIGLTADDTSAD